MLDLFHRDMQEFHHEVKIEWKVGDEKERHPDDDECLLWRFEGEAEWHKEDKALTHFFELWEEQGFPDVSRVEP